MRTKGQKQCCPHCGQTVNIREIGLFSGMVEALLRVYQWCERTGRWSDIRRAELEHCMRGSSESHRFHDWKIFAPYFVGKIRKGRYNFDREEIRRFLHGETMIPTIIERNPLTKTDTPKDFRYVKDIPNLKDFLNTSGDFVPSYLAA